MRGKKFNPRNRFRDKPGGKSKPKQFVHDKQKVIHLSFSRFKLFIEYEGTRYSGWQRQENAKTIQGEIVKAAKEIFDNDFLDLQGSGRTDSGVHALCQVAHLRCKNSFSSRNYPNEIK